MNRMEEIANLLDIELNEKFELENHGDVLFKLTEDGFFVYNYGNADILSISQRLIGGS